MINGGWKFTTEIEQVTEGVIANLRAEPVFPEIGEKVRELSANLVEKTLNQELIWSLQLVPMHTLESLREMIDNEVNHRETEFKKWKDKLKLREVIKHTTGKDYYDDKENKEDGASDRDQLSFDI